MNNLDQVPTIAPPQMMGWVNPPDDVTSAIEALRQHCEAWPMTPIDNPFHLVSGSADALCQAVTGHALFVPSDLAVGVSQVGMFMVLSACILIVAIAFAVGYIVRQWTRHFPPGPKIAKPPYDTLTSALALIGLLVGFSAAAMATRNTTSPVLAMVYMAATLLWIQVTPHVVVLLRSKP